MKLFFGLMLVASLVAPFAACTTSDTETTKRNWDGSTTNQRTTVRENPITGNTSVDQTKTTTR